MSTLGLDYRVKFSLVGDSGVGKSCMMSQLIDQNFLFSHEVTIGVDYGAAILDYEEEGIPRVKIKFTCRQEDSAQFVIHITKNYCAQLVAYL